METLITKGIKISVEPNYEPLHSNPISSKFLFSYHVEIENLSDSTVQLMSRCWYIFDSVGIKREVVGDGVIGQQPVLRPGQIHEYSSWCPLSSELGKMHGSFHMQRISDKSTFKVEIPVFELTAPTKLN